MENNTVKIICDLWSQTDSNGPKIVFTVLIINDWWEVLGFEEDMIEYLSLLGWYGLWTGKRLRTFRRVLALSGSEPFFINLHGITPQNRDGIEFYCLG
jgi:hypothetical protein